MTTPPTTTVTDAPERKLSTTTTTNTTRTTPAPIEEPEPVRPTARKLSSTTTTNTAARKPRERPAINARSRTWRRTWHSPSPGPSPAKAKAKPAPALRPLLSPSALSQLSISHNDFTSDAHVSAHDGRVHISVNALKAAAAPFRGLLSPQLEDDDSEGQEGEEGEVTEVKVKEKKEMEKPPRLNIVIMVIGSRGDVQPFIAVAKELQKDGHRVRLATHGAFREFVGGHDIEFFEVGGDPSELMAFMVKNPGLVPNVESIKAGEIAKRREQMYEMFLGFWRSCIEPCDGYTRRKNRKSSASARTESSASSHSSSGSDSEDYETEDDDVEPFVADAIIANPPSFAHVHCAEKLGVPLHLMFTFPYSPTQEIPHPLAFIQNSNLGSDYTNAITYPMVEMMTWQGLGDLVNRFREKTLFLEPVATLWAPGMISRLKVPFTYMWSPALIPKPADWGAHIDITGFVFLDQTKDYKPPDELQKFLDAGEPPVYIGFGSIVVDDPDELTNMIFEAVKATGVRALVSKGWGGLGGESDVPENIFMLGNTPHDWLFSRVSAVVHHGGAGTTAIGLKLGRPTLVVPFFGDQPFWGAMIANAGAGAEPVPHKDLTADKLADGIRFLLKDSTKEKAAEISARINNADGNGAANAVSSFYASLSELDTEGIRGLSGRGTLHGEGGPMGPGEGKWGAGGPGIRCNVLPSKVAVWRVRGTRIRLSALAACWYVRNHRLTWPDLRLVRHTEWNDFDGPGEPLSGGFSAFFGSIAGVTKGLFGVPYTLFKGARRIDAEVDLATELAPATTRARWRSKIHRHRNSASASASADESPSRHRHIGRDIRHGTRSALGKVARSAAHAPLDVSLAVAQGFHNAPRLYGDRVRRPARITGFHSGARAAGKELALGIYDGVTGLVTQPYRGARDGGVVGGLKGAGRGVAGVVLKTQAGLAGVVGYGLKGVHREMRKGRDRKVLERVMEARRKQGGRELDLETAAVAMGAGVGEGHGEGDGEAGADRDKVEELKRQMEAGWQTIVEDRELRVREKRGERGVARFRRRRKTLEVREREKHVQLAGPGKKVTEEDMDGEAQVDKGVISGRLGERERREMRRRVKRGFTA
ncbi:hypothetical protein EDC01DRAFT_785835 [Geopyxis carbonaria]|nr:hypothetical protein EDC01DRAFT_785835 [Geopyxis carbonaria]